MTPYTHEIDKVYTPTDIEKILKDIGDIPIKTKQKRGEKSDTIYYYEVPCAFDIETSSWYENGKKRATMYCWQFGINGFCVMGRTWAEFKKMMLTISTFLGLSKDFRLIVYAHNLSYEYQWIKNIIKFTEVFYIDKREPIKCLTDTGIEFRCSYALSGKGLEKLGKDLIKYPIQKKVGDMDYSKIRHTKTPLTTEEVDYCISDVKVVMSYIQEMIEKDSGIENILLTKTGYIRKMCRARCFGSGEDRKNYAQFMKRLTLTDEVYDMLKDAFQGGYVHCSAYYSGRTCHDVASYDFASSYPSVMVSQCRFPLSSPKKRVIKSRKEFEHYLTSYCCLFDITFYGLKLRSDRYAAPISSSKCVGDVDIEDNGRVIESKKLTTTITEQDFDVYRSFYTWDSIDIGKFYTFERGYLPSPIVDVLLDLYKVKTEYKDIEDKKAEYIYAKEDLNSGYGMIVTDIAKQYDSIDSYNKAFNRFLYYPWGVWVTAIARRNLFTAIAELGEDFIYSDTDSVKFKNHKNHISYFKNYNSYIVRCMNKAMTHYGFSIDRTRPKDKNGKERQMGIWDFEGIYDEFKAIRSKCYIYRIGEDYKLKLSGVKNDEGLKYLKSFGDPIESLKPQMIFTKGNTGKLIHTYIDEQIEGYVVDYMGKKAKYKELSYIHLEDAAYDMRYENEYFQSIMRVFDDILE